MSSKWEDVKLGDIVEIIGGGTPKTSVEEYWTPEEVNWVTAKDISNCQHRLILGTERKISKVGLEKSSAKMLDALTTVLIARGATTGKVALLSEPMAINQTCYGLKAKENIDSLFVYYLMLSRYNSFRAIANGSIFETVIGSGIKLIPVRIPNYNTQKKIGSILAKLDEKIETNQKIILTLEESIEVLFKYWFIEFEFPNERGLPYRSSGGEMVESELGEIPLEWYVVQLGNLSEAISKGTTPRKKDLEKVFETVKIPFLKVRDISDNGEIDYGFLEKIPLEIHENQLKRSKSKSNDILISIAGTIGRISYVPDTIKELNMNQAVAFVRLKDRNHFNFIYSTVKQSDFKNYLTEKTVQAVQANVSLTTLKEFELCFPDNRVLNSWNEKVNGIYKMIENLRNENITLRSTRDILLPKLISGEIEIPNESVVEPS